MNLLFKNGKIDQPILKDLSKLFSIQEYDFLEIEKCTAVVFDLSNKAPIDEALLNQIKRYEKPIIVINPDKDADKMSAVFGIGFDSEVSIVFQYEKSTFISPVTSAEKDKFVFNEESFIHVETDKKGARVESAPKTKKLDSNTVKQELSNIPELIEAQVQEESWLKNKSLVANSASSIPPTDLPEGQYKIFHVELNKVIHLEDRPQTATNQMLLEIWLIASYNPKRKYVQIYTKGAGFHPASGDNISRDDTYGRGHFQNRITTEFEPTNNSRVITYDTYPDNVNNETSYTSSSSFTVGVDVSKNPAFKPSYTVGSSETTTITDYTLTNNSSGSRAKWDFQLSKTKNSIWDIFSESFMEKAKVKSLPTLAKSNLQPVCTAVWMVNEDSGVFNSSVNFHLSWSVEYYYCWVTGDWVSYKKKIQWVEPEQGRSTNFSVNYSLVST